MEALRGGEGGGRRWRSADQEMFLGGERAIEDDSETLGLQAGGTEELSVAREKVSTLERVPMRRI